MGLAGALGGMGSGMSAFSESLREKRKLDWQTREAQLQHKRNLHLEELRAANQMKSQKQKQDWETQQSEVQFGRQSAGFYGDREVTRNELSALQESEGYDESMFKNPELYKLEKERELRNQGRQEDLQFELDKTEKIYNLQSKLERQKAQKEYERVSETPEFKELPESQQYLIKNKMLNPLFSSLIPEDMSDKDKVDLYAEYNKGREQGYKLWEVMTPEQQKSFIKAEGLSKDSDHAEAYASKYAAFGLPDEFKDVLELSDGPVRKVKLSSTQDQMSMARDIVEGDPEALINVHKLEEESLQAVLSYAEQLRQDEEGNGKSGIKSRSFISILLEDLLGRTETGEERPAPKRRIGAFFGGGSQVPEGQESIYRPRDPSAVR